MAKYPADFYGVSVGRVSTMPSDIAYCSSAGGYFDRSWYGDPQPVAIRVGFVQCEYCATSQKRPDNGKCCACGGPTPHREGAA